jgi:uncharacterized protein YigA (DUF484 family)
LEEIISNLENDLLDANKTSSENERLKKTISSLKNDLLDVDKRRDLQQLINSFDKDKKPINPQLEEFENIWHLVS